MKPIEIIKEFDEFLKLKKATFTGVAIGGAPLVLLGIITRETRDCDIIDPVIPKQIEALAVEFAKEKRARGGAVEDTWFNNGPISLKDKLPKDWKNRLQLVFKGKVLTLYAPCREDLLKTKLLGLCDRGTDKSDCLALRPTKKELGEAVAWVKDQDGNPGWPKHVEEVLADLAKDLGYGL